MIGLGRLLILLGIGVGLWMAWRWLKRTPPEKLTRHLTLLSIGVAVVILMLLAATGRLPPLFAAIGAALGAVLTLAQRLLRMPWALGLARRLFHFYHQQKNSSGSAAGQRSQVETPYLRMYLDHENGELRGEVIAGRFAGYRIDELELSQLSALWRDYIGRDRESAALLEAYLDRTHGKAWRRQGDREEAGTDHSPPTSGPMTPEEAYKILGIAPGASEEEVIAAHRRLAQRLHPDRGGSTYLAAKINRAKDVLLGRTNHNG